MRPTDERGRPIGASPGGLPAGDRGDPVGPGRGDPVGPRRAGGRAGGRLHAEAGFDIGRTSWHFVLSVVEKPSSKVSLVYCGLFETESVLHWF